MVACIYSWYWLADLCAKEGINFVLGQAGKKLGTSGDEIGNAYFKWAFSEAAVLFVAKCAQGRTILAARLGVPMPAGFLNGTLTPARHQARRSVDAAGEPL